MDIGVPLHKMSVEDKLRLIEQVWEDLVRTPQSVPSPVWHRDVLEARQKRFTEGRESFLPWETAKKDLRSKKP